VDVFVPHQANLRIINATGEDWARSETTIINIDRYGNTTAATIPLAMQTAIEQGKMKKGSLVLLASVGRRFHRRCYIIALGLTRKFHHLTGENHETEEFCFGRSCRRRL